MHTQIMMRYTAYKTLNGPKVLSGCISDVPNRRPRFRAHQVFAWHTGQTSDKQIFAGKLRQNALQTCMDWAAAENVDCDCFMIDSNDKNVLDLPDAQPGQAPGGDGTISSPGAIDKKV